MQSDNTEMDSCPARLDSGALQPVDVMLPKALPLAFQGEGQQGAETGSGDMQEAEFALRLEWNVEDTGHR